MRRAAGLAVAAVALAAALAAAREADPGWTSAKRWSALREPKAGQPRVIGSYAGGCVQGAEALPDSGPGFEVLHRGRHRFFGHPDLVDFVRRLAGAAAARGLPPLLIGDLGQPRGGPTPTDHGSHQSGLDVDVSFTRPADAMDRPLAADERERTHFPVVFDLVARKLTPAWNPRIATLLELAATDASVDRIFVNAAIKRELCKTARAPWLQTLRPWWNHHDHFHVRLKCPAGSPSCRPQPALAKGDGCGGDLAWWFGKEATAPRKISKKRPAAPKLPPGCRALLR